MHEKGQIRSRLGKQENGFRARKPGEVLVKEEAQIEISIPSMDTDTADRQLSFFPFFPFIQTPYKAFFFHVPDMSDSTHSPVHSFENNKNYQRGEKSKVQLFAKYLRRTVHYVDCMSPPNRLPVLKPLEGLHLIRTLPGRGLNPTTIFRLY